MIDFLIKTVLRVAMAAIGLLLFYLAYLLVQFSSPDMLAFSIMFAIIAVGFGAAALVVCLDEGEWK